MANRRSSPGVYFRSLRPVTEFFFLLHFASLLFEEPKPSYPGPEQRQKIKRIEKMNNVGIFLPCAVLLGLGSDSYPF